jgi:hypothetical protein
VAASSHVSQVRPRIGWRGNSFADPMQANSPGVKPGTLLRKRKPTVSWALSLAQGAGFGTGGFLGFFCSFFCLSRFPMIGLLVEERTIV